MRALALVAILVTALKAPLARAVDVTILWLERHVSPPPVLSNLDPVPEDLGLTGAQLGIADSNTTGRFLGPTYTLRDVVLDEAAPMEAGVLAGADIVVAKLPDQEPPALADLPEAAGALIFNASDAGDALRREDCRANPFHTPPSHEMRADALAQFLLKKKWTEIFLVSGPAPADVAFADAVRRAVAKLGLEIAVDKLWPFAADLRHTAGQEHAAWVVGRLFAEAVTRTGAADAASVRAYLLSDDFKLAAFKGRKMSFRDWNGQLRQPIPLVTERALVASAPLDGFLHAVSELDMLGHDRRASGCTAFELGEPHETPDHGIRGRRPCPARHGTRPRPPRALLPQELAGARASDDRVRPPDRQGAVGAEVRHLLRRRDRRRRLGGVQLSGAEFFRTIWIDEIVVNDLEVRPMGLHSLEFDDEGTVELSFIAIRPGRYELRIQTATLQVPIG